MNTRRLGDRQVHPIGVGAMWLSLLPGRPARHDAIATLHAALDHGATLIDTADAYALDATEMGHNERLVAEAIRRWEGDRDGVVVASKGGHVRDTAGGWSLNGSADHLRVACERSREALGVQRIDLYYLHRPDPDRPFEDGVEALAGLQADGLIANIGLSNVTVEQIRSAERICRIAAVQNEFSPRFRRSRVELEYCTTEGIAFLPWRALGGINDAEMRRRLYGPFDEVARSHEVSPQQIALAWVLRQAGNVIAIPGMTRPATAADSLRAATIHLTDAELRTLDRTPHPDVASD